MAKEPIERTYVIVDSNELSTKLAEDSWIMATNNLPIEDLYEEENRNEIRSKWATLFFNLKDRYKEYINLCSKERIENEQ